MRLLSKFLIISITGLAAVVAVLLAVGIGVIDNVVYENHARILRTELDSLEQQLNARPAKAVIPHKDVLRQLEEFERRTGDFFFAYRLDGELIYPETSALPQFSAATAGRMIEERTGSGWIAAGEFAYLARFVVLADRDLMVGVRVPETTVYAGRARYVLAVSGVALLTLISGSIIAFFLGRALTGRIGVTLEALDAVGAGEFGIQIPDTGGRDELSEIQRRINDLSDSFARRATEREAATKWLEENEKRFRDFAATASDAFWETDSDHRYTFFVNPGHEFGNFQNDQSIIGTVRGEYFDKKDFFTGDWEQHLRDLDAHRVIRNFEFSGQYPDGNIFHRTSNAVPIFDSDGAFKGYRGTTTDITDRIETQQKFHNLVANLPAMVFQRLLYPDDRIEFSHLSGSSAHWLRSKEIEQDLAAWRTGNLAHPDDREELRKVILENARAGKAFSTEFRTIAPDGKIFWLRTVCAAATTRQDGVIVQDGVVFDITDIKNAKDEAQQSERRLTEFAISASDTLWESDTEHRMTWMSDPETTENRYPDTKVMIGLRRWEFPGAAPRNDPSWAPLISALENRQPFREFEFEVQLENGQNVVRRISGRPIFNDDGEFAGYRGISSDITNRVLKDRDARETQQRLIDAIEASDQGIVLFGADDRLIFANRFALDISPEMSEVFIPGEKYEDLVRTAARNGNFPDAGEDEEGWVQRRLAYHKAPSGPFTNIKIGNRYIEIREERLPNGGWIIRQTDVTDQSLAQQALRESEERFRDFAESSSDWMWEMDADFRFTSATSGAEGSEFLTPEAFIGRTRWEAMGIDVENDDNWCNHIEDLIAHRPFRDFRYSRVSPNGRTLHRSASGVPYYSSLDGSFKGYRGTTTDITDQVEAEQRYRNLIEQSPTPMIVNDGHTIAYLNPAAIEMYGANSADDIIGKSVFEYIHPDERLEFSARISSIMDNGEVTPVVERRRVRIDGSEIIVMVRGVPVMWDGKRAALGALIDITDRVQAERQYRELIENAPMALSVDDGERFIFVNQAFADMFGKGHPDEIIGREIVEMAHPDEVNNFRDRVRAVSHYRRTLPISQIQRRRFDGSTLTALSRGVPIVWEGKPATLGIQLDISERIKAQQALEESEERFRSLVEGSRQGVLIHVDFTPVFVNATLAKMFGYTSEADILSLSSVLDLVAPEAREQWRSNRLARLSGMEIDDDYEFPGLRKDGSRIWVHITVRLVNWQNRTAIQGTMIVVTRRREAEERIRESEERFRLLTSTSPVGIFVTDAQGNCEYINEAYEKMSGLSIGQATGKGWAAAIHPDDKDRVFEEWYAGVQTEGPIRTEFRFQRPDGKIVWAIAQAVAQRDANGMLVKYIGAITDVTGRVRAELARKNSDERFRTLTMLSPVGVFLTDENGRVEYVNDALAKMLNMRPEDALGNDWISGIHPEDREQFLNAWQRAYASKGNLEMELRMNRRDETVKWVLVQASPLSAGIHLGESPGGYIGAVTDITERRFAEEQLRQVHKMDAIGQLTGGIAHDFNNLLAIVQGNLELLRERAPDDGRLTGLINAAHGAARRGATLNQRLLAFARRQPLAPSLCNINEVVSDMAGLFARTLGDNVELRTQFAEGLWRANIDPNGLETAVLNLAINARDAMPDGGALIITTANRTYGPNNAAPDPDMPDGEYVLLRVTDSGTGMDDETLRKAFDPFYTTKGMGKGSGLGLSMVYGFARQSGGTAIVESALGQGTAISLLFPRIDAAFPSQTPRSVVSVPEGGGEKILIVEDDLDVRDMAVGMFESLNYKTLIAASAEEALSVLDRDDGIELLFTDVMLGTGDNGPELAKKARQGRPGLRILFASGYATDDFGDGAPLQMGALLNKPYDRADLARAVRAALETGRA
tara:strand:- start:4377 stop:10016 length:5640 start_codon:yes stop_codon:yes gene_type:complete